MSRERQGIALCVLAAAGFGAMAILVKEAFAAGLDTSTLLALRFTIAAAVLWAIVRARRAPRVPRRIAVRALALGAIGYVAQAAAFYGALARIDAALASMLLYAYPALVCVAAIALRRESADGRRLGALAVATCGTGLVLLGSGGGAIDPLGAALGLAAAGAYAAYILTAARILDGADPLAFAATVATGAAFGGFALALAQGGPHLAFAASGWLWIAALAVVSTVIPVSAFLLGLERVGPSAASVASTIEPLITVSLAFAILGERLAPVQALGGAAILAAVLALQADGLRARVAATG